MVIECYQWLRTVIDGLLSVIDGVDECYQWLRMVIDSY